MLSLPMTLLTLPLLEQRGDAAKRIRRQFLDGSIHSTAELSLDHVIPAVVVLFHLFYSHGRGASFSAVPPFTGSLKMMSSASIFLAALVAQASSAGDASTISILSLTPSTSSRSRA